MQGRFQRPLKGRLLVQLRQGLSGLVLANEIGGRSDSGGQALFRARRVSNPQSGHPEVILDLRVLRKLGGALLQKSVCPLVDAAIVENPAQSIRDAWIVGRNLLRDL